MKDIHLPDPVSWWPPAPGWWLLPLAAALLTLAVRRLAPVWRRHLERRRLRRQAFEELARIEAMIRAGGESGEVAQRLSVLLRRVAITLFADDGVAGRAGRAWVDWLRETTAGDFDAAPLGALADAPYQPAPEVSLRPVLDAARAWIDHATRRPAASS